MQIRSFKKFVILCDELVIGKKSSSSNLIFQTKGCQKSSKDRQGYKQNRTEPVSGYLYSYPQDSNLQR